jgi:lysophospholipase L1-like esterase
MQFFLRNQRTFLTKKMEEIKEIHPNIIFEEIDLKLSPEFFASDGVHPSDMGYEAIAQFAIDGIKRWRNKV